MLNRREAILGTIAAGVGAALPKSSSATTTTTSYTIPLWSFEDVVDCYRWGEYPNGEYWLIDRTRVWVWVSYKTYCDYVIWDFILNRNPEKAKFFTSLEYEDASQV